MTEANREAWKAASDKHVREHNDLLAQAAAGSSLNDVERGLLAGILRLRAELDSLDAAAAMRAYADQIDARAAALEAPASQEAREWAGWIRDPAERTTR